MERSGESLAGRGPGGGRGRRHGRSWPMAPGRSLRPLWRGDQPGRARVADLLGSGDPLPRRRDDAGVRGSRPRHQSPGAGPGRRPRHGERLDEPEIGRACVETIGENTCDAIVAPLVLAGPRPDRSVSGPTRRSIPWTAWSGTATPSYLYFGKASARLDDAGELLIPARLDLAPDRAGGLDHDRREWTRSPLSGWAGATAGSTKARTPPGARRRWPARSGFAWEGRSTYDGVPSDKPFLGNPGPPIGPATVRRAVRVMQVAALIAAGLALVGQVLLS